MARKLIVNADGFGFTHGNNRGILECLPAGVIKSVSVNANFPAVAETPKLIEQFGEVSVGIHLDLSVGPCVSDAASIPDLVDENGTFLGPEFSRKAARGQIPHEQMVRELTGQVERLIGLGEIACHPGYPDETLRKYSSMTESRLKEVELFKSDALTRLTEELNVEPVSFAALDRSLPGRPDSQGR